MGSKNRKRHKPVMDRTSASPHAGTGIGAKMLGGNPDPERGRAENDFYATPEPVTRALIAEYPDYIEGKSIWEPCAGDGAMAAVLRDARPANILCSDIAPQPVVERANGLTIYAVDALRAKRLPPGVSAVITNPPFVIAPAIIRHMLTLEGGAPQLLALVLKATFWHAASRYKLFEEHPPTAIHPLLWRPDFRDLGGPTMEFMWCVWEKEQIGTLPVYVPFEHPDAAAMKGRK